MYHISAYICFLLASCWIYNYSFRTEWKHTTGKLVAKQVWSSSLCYREVWFDNTITNHNHLHVCVLNHNLFQEEKNMKYSFLLLCSLVCVQMLLITDNTICVNKVTPTHWHIFRLIPMVGYHYGLTAACVYIYHLCCHKEPTKNLWY